MVTQSTNLTRNGLTDWLVQRISSVIVAAYVIFLLGYLLCHSTLSFEQWSHLFSHTAMRVFSILFILSLIAHAWVGIWTVLTDYVKCACLRGGLQVIVILSLLAFLIWGVMIIWSV